VLPRCVVSLAAAMVASVWAQEGDAERVVVTGSVKERITADAPYAISVVDRAELRRSGPLINLSEALVRVPGLVVNNRNNYAQDLQMSSRGFGSRATFGVRGLRLYTDGIPATMPDGQGQPGHFDLGEAQRIEVLRGPFSVLYGNSSGGVVSLFTAPVTRTEGEGALDLGSFGLRQIRASLGTPLGDVLPGGDVRIGIQGMEIDGFRPHSEAERTLLSLRFGWQDANNRVVWMAGKFSQPAQDPLGLDREQFDEDPYQTTPQAIEFDTRKEADQWQTGLSWVHRFDEGALRESRLTGYYGRRSVTQWQAIPPAAQASPRHGGGVVDFDRDYYGGEARLRWAWERFELVLGGVVEVQKDDRRGYENFVGDPPDRVLGVTGRLRRDEQNSAQTTDLFAQGEWTITPTLVANAGVRGGQVSMESEDDYLSNGDDSGEVDYDYVNPVLGLRWQVAPRLQLHASAARGFESPTLGELAYRPDGEGGFNTALDPQTSRQYEIGAKWRGGDFSLDAALFRADTDDEIGVLTNAGGRSSFQNVGRTRRQGAELGAGWAITPAWRTAAALTWLDATYTDGFLTCGGVPCLEPTVPVPAGNRIAGTSKTSGWAELVWTDARFGEWGVEWRGMGNTVVNDVNSDAAAGYGLFNLRWLKAVPLAAGSRAEFLVRLDNLADRAYAGSVIVNDGNRRYFETGAPRAILVSLRVVGGL
jgi:iron complex outermembrane receptor protein